MKTSRTAIVILIICYCALQADISAQAVDEKKVNELRKAAIEGGGDVAAGKVIFESQRAGCSKCHAIKGTKRMAGPDLMAIGDKFDRSQLIQSVLKPSARLHPDFASTTIIKNDGKVVSGVLYTRDKRAVQLFDKDGKLISIPTSDIDEQKKSNSSLMPIDIYKTMSNEEFSNLVAYLETLRQDLGKSVPGMPNEIPLIDRPIRLTPFHSKEMKFDHPVLIKAIPGTSNQYLIVEQMTRKIWRLEKRKDGDRKTLFGDLSHESITGKFEGVMCLDFHPKFTENGRYFVNYHVREDGVFSPVIAERKASADRMKDAGGSSRRLLRIKQPTDLHWGGMLAFGPDGYLYIGSGDGGPQEDPLGNGQNHSLFLGSILRIDVDRKENGKPYAIPKTNPYRNAKDGTRPEIWASGFRMPWRFTWDSKTGDMWVGDIGQTLFEEINMPRLGENHGWNVYEGFVPFSDRYRKAGREFTPPVFSYRRRHGVSVTGGYVYRGTQNDSYVGAYIFGDFESKRIWALTQKNRQLVKVRQIGSSPEKISSFGVAANGEIFAVGYEGTIFQVVLDDSKFE